MAELVIGKIIVQEDITLNNMGRLPQRNVYEYYSLEEATPTHIVNENLFSAPYQCYKIKVNDEYQYIQKELCVVWDEFVSLTLETEDIQDMLERDYMDKTANVYPLYEKYFGINIRDTYRPQYESERLIRSAEPESPGDQEEEDDEWGPCI